MYSYFNSILESTPGTIMDAIVDSEVDGKWHTSDDTFASDTWRKMPKYTLIISVG